MTGDGRFEHYPADHPAIDIAGALGLVRTGIGVRPTRLTPDALRRIPTAGMRAMVDAAAGVRVRFTTSATTISITATVAPIELIGSLPRFSAVIDLVIDGDLVASRVVGTGTALVDGVADSIDIRGVVPETVTFEGLGTREKLVELWLPHTAVVELIGITASAPLRHASRTGRRWLHHGSSISHCLEASHPFATWPAIAASRLGYDLIDLGFAGNALLDPFVAGAIRDTEADLITLKLGINLVNGDVIRQRMLAPLVHGFLDTVREGHPLAPIVLISPILCPMVEDQPGPTVLDPSTGIVSAAPQQPLVADALTLGRIRDAFERIVDERDDPLLMRMDGRHLFAEGDVAEGHLPDGLHPDQEGYRRMGERFARLLPALEKARLERGRDRAISPSKAHPS